jgi:hypothetical protein
MGATINHFLVVPPAQWRARGLRSGSSTLGTIGPKILDATGSPQRQTIMVFY